MNYLSNLFHLQQIELIVRLIVSAICGYMIGFERKNRKKEAGIRTHIIVAIASCLMMEISKYGFSDTGKFDGARIAAQVVSGIGFLGAGTIFVHKNTVKGLTTAAGIWATSGIGMAVGAGMYVIGIVTALIIILLQVFFHKNFKFLHHVNNETIIFVVHDSPGAIDMVKDIMSSYLLTCDDASIFKLPDSKIRIDITSSFPEDFDMFEFAKKASEHEEVISVCNNLSNAQF